MSVYFEIAYATASRQLCLFTGTGFSKAITDNVAPSWKALLETMCDRLPGGGALRDTLFAGEASSLGLEEVAQVLALNFTRNGKNLHREIATYIETIQLAGDNLIIQKFFQEHSLRIVTTNYDKLAEALADPSSCHSIAPGMPVPRYQADVKAYHVHGSVSSPDDMVVTSDDYFRFINSESYFSRKLSTLLHENTVVILGYSLGDTNLKAIINDYKRSSRDQAISANIFYVSKSKIDQHIKDYYAHCYGIRVLDEVSVHTFFRLVHAEIPAALECLTKTRENISKVLNEGAMYSDDYLKVESSFFKIISSVSAIGRSTKDPAVVAALEKIIRRKIELTGENGAWVQYEHLARWLIYLGSMVELGETSIKDTYLEAALKSLKSMSRQQIMGYSWQAYKAWDRGWSEVIAANRALIKAHVETYTDDPDAREVVARG